jgi:hypothetical protein
VARPDFLSKKFSSILTLRRWHRSAPLALDHREAVSLGFAAVAAEIQLLPCGYPARCSVRRCEARATMLARYTDNQGRPLKQRELCERHADWLRAKPAERPRFDTSQRLRELGNGS